MSRIPFVPLLVAKDVVERLASRFVDFSMANDNGAGGGRSPLTPACLSGSRDVLKLRVSLLSGSFERGRERHLRDKSAARAPPLGGLK
jgi:hypothetical protein